MSAIFGIFQLDHSAIDPAALQAMDSTLSYWGPHGGGLRLDGPLGLGCRLLHITAEDTHEQQPLEDPGCILVTHLRLDNRSELCRTLGLIERPELPDSALLRAAYQHYGLECLHHLQGDWVLAIWDRARAQLLLARCATGTAGLYWTQQGRRLLFATGIKGVLAHPDYAPALNPTHLAALLLTCEDPQPDSTVYEGLHLLEPGQMLLASAAGVELRRWWRPETLAPLKFRNPADYYQAFRELYTEVVSQQLRVGTGGIAATLSGGLDSSSVVALAAPRLPQPLTAYVHTPLYPPWVGADRIGDELPQAQRVAAQVGNVALMPLRSEHVSIMRGIEQSVWMYDAPGHAAGNDYWLVDILERAQATGTRVLLTGQGGNATVSYTGNGNLLPQLWAGQWWPLLHELFAEQSGLGRALKLRLLKPLLSPLRAHAEQGRINPTALIHPEFAQRQMAPLLNRQGEIAALPPRVAFRLGLQGAGRGRARWMAAAAAYHLEMRDPTRDRRIVEFCWRLPDAVFWGQGQQRALIRSGMATYLPAEIRDERRKGLQSADIQGRMQAQAQELEAALQHLSSSTLAGEYLDLARMRTLLARIVAGGHTAGGVMQAHALARALSVGHFLAGLR